MKALLIATSLIFGLSAAAIGHAQAPAGAPAGSTGLCKDGTYYSGDSKKGACRGHKGIKDWYASNAAAPAANDAAAPADKKSKKSKKDSAAAAPAAAPATASAAKPANATGQCKDGSYTTGESKKGACRGHKGVQDWYAAAAAAAAAPAAAPAASKASSAAPAAAAPAAAPAGATGLCKDGTYYSGESKKGACRGHKGVQDWYGATAAAPAKPSAPASVAPAAAAPAAAAPKMTPAPTAAPAAPAAKTPAAPATAAAGGGNGKVWLNSETKVYHCEGDRYYGTTKQGEYMSEADALAKGAHASHGKACSK